MTDKEMKAAAKQFVEIWIKRGNEKSDAQMFWHDLLANVLGMSKNFASRVNYEKTVIVDGQTKFIDVFIPETKVLIEQKSMGKSLSKGVIQSGGTELTPYQQAKRYSDNLPYDEKPRWIIVSNFSEIRIHDMNAKQPEKEYESIALKDLPKECHRLKFLVDAKEDYVTHEVSLSIEAGVIIGEIYKSLLEQYPDKENPEYLQSLNKLCVRLVFCMYAEDSGLFGSHLMFHDYMEQYAAKDWGETLEKLFSVLDTKPENRKFNLAEDLAAFPYVNGGLFADENLLIPRFTDEIRTLILEDGCGFDWSEISPTIFGAVFESTLNPETRRKGGMHYTSIENIHKVIDPLFLDDLKEELEKVKKNGASKKGIQEYQKKLSNISVLDPACGSGNFLTETFVSLRKLENEAIQAYQGDQITLGTVFNPIEVSINQFYGIEINDFAVTVAKTALWIAEHQMAKATEGIVHMPIEFLPLKTYSNIVEGNALRIDWQDVVPKDKLSYIIGNPPFVGANHVSDTQRPELMDLFEKDVKAGQLDYVAGWYKKAALYMQGTSIQAALVSTNSITQGEQVPILWNSLQKNNVHIDFAYRTFQWDSEAKIKAHVHCVIIGFSIGCNHKPCIIYDGETPKPVKVINGYLEEYESIYIERRKKPLCEVPEIRKGNQPTDGGNLILSAEEYEDFVKQEKMAKPFIKRLVGAKEYLNNIPRYCLWLVNATPKELRDLPLVMKRIEKVKEARLASGNVKLAKTPYLFREQNNPKTFIIIPSHTSENRDYIPLGFLDNNFIPTNAALIIPNATLYHFGILTSSVHMSWMRYACGRLKSDYRYSKEIVYNNFPWPTPTEQQKAKIEQTGQAILDVRNLYPDSSLADLYDADIMKPELRKAHEDNDKAVMQAYGFSSKMTESEIVEKLLKMYQKLIENKEK